jgi:hypothetical protein
VGVPADLVSMFVNLNIGPEPSHLLDSFETGFLDDDWVVVL